MATRRVRGLRGNQPVADIGGVFHPAVGRAVSLPGNDRAVCSDTGHGHIADYQRHRRRNVRTA